MLLRLLAGRCDLAYVMKYFYFLLKKCCAWVKKARKVTCGCAGVDCDAGCAARVVGGGAAVMP